MLYSTPMVQATLANRKKLTRRTQGLEEINKNPDAFELRSTFIIGDDVNVKDKKAVGFHAIFKNSQGHRKSVKAKYATGDIIWVRETFMNCNPLNFDNEKCFLYKSDFPTVDLTWKPSIHMPKAAARIFLEITNVRCERLKDITEADAIAEGIRSKKLQASDSTSDIIDFFTDYSSKQEDFSIANRSYFKYQNNSAAVHCFMTLWESINGKDSWKANPWVWVYEFKKIEKPAVWPS